MDNTLRVGWAGGILRGDTRGWYPSPHPGSRTRATVLSPLAEAGSVVTSGSRLGEGSQAGVPHSAPPDSLLHLKEGPAMGGTRREGVRPARGPRMEEGC